MNNGSLTKRFPCIESTYEITIENNRIRLWINEEILKDTNEEIIETLKKIKGTKQEIIDWCANNIPNINAVQVIDINNDKGIVAYTVDFTDPHG